MFNNKKLLFVILLAVSVATHFAFFGHPNQTVFDEVHFGKFVSGYLAGEYFFDIHPPLGKLLFTGVAHLGGFSPEFAFDTIGSAFPNWHYMVLRFLPILAGALLPLVLFGIALYLGFSPVVAFLVGTLTALDGALIIQSRFILLDAFLLLFGFLSIFFYLRFKKTAEENAPHFYNLWLAGAFGALSGSIKWTGFGFLALVLVMELFRLWPNFNLFKFWKNHHRHRLAFVLSLIVAPFLIYLAIFAIHFHLLPKTGPGDAFMSASFQKTLEGSRYQSDPAVETEGFLKKFTELNLQMYSANQRLTATHPYGSAWYTWPLMSRPIYYWNKAEPMDNNEPQERKIYLMGNVVVWWASTIAILTLALSFLSQTWKRKNSPWVVHLILGAYFLNLLPFMGVQRVMFLYHYFPALIFAIFSLGYLIDHKPNTKTVSLVLIGLAAIIFLTFSPLVYGLSQTVKESDKLFWFPSWR
ncbi:MAG: phospholipid carrier-dependent glycosyltransferase [bacterium]|nr:phospholipid carrier-dependent glycosyltransferase [bacterium]